MANAATRDWQFAVYLDDTLIGDHHFSVIEDAAGIEVRSDARFSVKLLSFEIYHYLHSARERWREQCLASIEAQTDDNGKRTRIEGHAEAASAPAIATKSAGVFVLTGAQGSQRIDGCLHSFAYWNRRFLDVPRLLNPQDGNVVDATLSQGSDDSISVRGVATAARRYTLKAPGKLIDLWYDSDGQWLALESTTESGRRVRYRLN